MFLMANEWGEGRFLSLIPRAALRGTARSDALGRSPRREAEAAITMLQTLGREVHRTSGLPAVPEK